VDPDGAITLVMEFEQAVGSFDGQTLDVTAKMPRVTQTLDKQGRLHSKLEGGADPTAVVMLEMIDKAGEAQIAGLPPRPVKVGETWKLTPPDALNSKAQWSGLATLASVESSGGDKTLKVNYGTDASIDGPAPTKVHSGATLLIDVLTGKTIKLASRTDAWVGQTKTTVDIQYNHIDDTAYTIQRTYRAGDVNRYRIHMVSTTSDPQMGGKDHVVKNDMIVRETVKSVDPDGTVTILDEFECAGSSIDNMDVDLTESMPKVTQTRNSQGDLQVKVQGGDTRFTDPVLQMMLQIARGQDVIPTKPVKVGTSWRFTADAGTKDKTTGTVLLESVEGINGVKALKLKRVADTSGGEAAAGIHEEITTLLDALTGKTLKLTSRSISSTGESKTTVDIAYGPAEDKAEAGSGK